MPLLQTIDSQARCDGRFYLQQMQEQIHGAGILSCITMMSYKCLGCGKEVKQEYIKKKVRCPYCGYKILYKARSVVTKVRAV